MSRVFLAAACLGVLTDPVQAVLVISFEEEEGFVAGDTASGREGWTGSTGTGARANSAVTNQEAYDGTQSLFVNNGVSNSFFVVSPNFFEYEATSASLQLKVLGAEFPGEGVPIGARYISRWEIYLGDSMRDTMAEYSRIAMVLRWNTTEEGDFQISAENTNVDAEAGRPAYLLLENPNVSNVVRNLIDSVGNLLLESWNEISLILNAQTKTLDISVGGSRSRLLSISRTPLRRIHTLPASASR